MKALITLKSTKTDEVSTIELETPDATIPSAQLAYLTSDKRLPKHTLETIEVFDGDELVASAERRFSEKLGCMALVVL